MQSSPPKSKTVHIGLQNRREHIYVYKKCCSSYCIIFVEPTGLGWNCAFQLKHHIDLRVLQKLTLMDV